MRAYQRWNKDFTRERAFKLLRKQRIGQYLVGFQPKNISSPAGGRGPG